jgi:hypothetical protein
MSNGELLSYLGLALAGLVYWAYQNKAALWLYLFSPKVVSLPADNWRTDWVQTLMSLQIDLELEGEEQCVPLVRELIWRLLGGEPNEVQGRRQK